MQKNIIRVFFILTVFLCLFHFKIEGRALIYNKTDKTIILKAGEKKKFKILNNNQQNIVKYVKLSSSNKKVFTVDKNGYLHGKKPGKANLICKSSKWKIVYTVIVKNKSLMTYGTRYNNAKELKISKTFKRYISNIANNNEHWFYFEIKNDGKVNIDLLPDPDVDLYVELYAENGDSRIDDTGGANKHLTMELPLQKGRFYLKVTCNNKAGNYKININSEAAELKNDKTKNDTFQQASSVSLNNKITGHLGYITGKGMKDELDWYKLAVNEPVYLNLELVGSPGLEQRLYLYGVNGSDYINKNSGRDMVIELGAPLQKGIYYIANEWLGGYGSYTLMINSEKSDNTYGQDLENNDSFQYAVDLTSVRSSKGNIGYFWEDCSRDEADWYKIDTPFNEEFTVTLIPESTIKDIEIIIYKGNGADGVSSARGYNEILNAVKEEKDGQEYVPSTYYVCVLCREGYGGYEIFY